MDDGLIRKIRSFNRYYTVWLDVMNKGYLGMDFSWPVSRVLFEIYLSCEISATELCEHLNMDKSYVSRLLSKLEKSGFITRELVQGSRGIKKIRLTDAGRERARQVDLCADRQISEKLRYLDDEKCGRLCEAMALIEKILRDNDGKIPRTPFDNERETE